MSSSELLKLAPPKSKIIINIIGGCEQIKLKCKDFHFVYTDTNWLLALRHEGWSRSDVYDILARQLKATSLLDLPDKEGLDV